MCASHMYEYPERVWLYVGPIKCENIVKNVEILFLKRNISYFYTRLLFCAIF